jgi:hypothetical protein
MNRLLVLLLAVATCCLADNEAPEVATTPAAPLSDLSVYSALSAAAVSRRHEFNTVRAAVHKANLTTY